MATRSQAQRSRPAQQRSKPTQGSQDVAAVAYELFWRRGGVHGHDLEDWLEAERLLRSRRKKTW